MTDWSDSIPAVPSKTEQAKQGRKAQKEVPLINDGFVRMRREVKGRGGSTVIVISGIPLTDHGIKELAGALKKKCGCGGTAKNGTIEIQGDHRDILSAELMNRGFKIKMAGG